MGHSSPAINHTQAAILSRLTKQSNSIGRGACSIFFFNMDLLRGVEKSHFHGFNLRTGLSREQEVSTDNHPGVGVGLPIIDRVQSLLKAGEQHGNLSLGNKSAWLTGILFSPLLFLRLRFLWIFQFLGVFCFNSPENKGRNFYLEYLHCC